MVNRDKAMSILQEEASLNEIVQLVGKDSLSAADQLTLETAKMLREDFLQQNGFMEVDWYSSYERQDKMIQMILDYDKLCRAAIEKGAATAELFAIPFREQMGRAKSVDRTTGTPPSTPTWPGRWRSRSRTSPPGEVLRNDQGIPYHTGGQRPPDGGAPGVRRHLRRAGGD